MTESEKWSGKRLGALDYGRKRIGFAVCDELHITVNPRKYFLPDDHKFWDDLLKSIQSENLAAIIVGVPYRYDGETTDVIVELENFIEVLKEKSGLEVIPFDESYSSRRSMATMIEIGKKRRTRSQKGNVDKIAAAIILRDFLNEIEG